MVRVDNLRAANSGAEGAGAVTLQLRLVAMPSDRVRGIYDIKGKPDRMPDRSLFLHPDVVPDYLAIADQVVVSDMFRDATGSLLAKRSKRGAAAPGYSAHNYGLAIDIDIAATRHNLRATSKGDLDAKMAAHGFVCLRTDHDTGGFESWHYTHLGRGYQVTSHEEYLTAETEARIRQFYAAQWRPTAWQCQEALARLRLYHGEIDGILGPLSIEAMTAFKRTWGLFNGRPWDAKARRTLAYVAAERVIEPLVTG